MTFATVRSAEPEIFLTLGAALYLLPAGLIEGFLSPSDIPWSLRIPVAAAFGSVFFLHFSGRAGRIWAGGTAGGPR